MSFKYSLIQILDVFGKHFIICGILLCFMISYFPLNLQSHLEEA